jgi:hypothetical protein
VWEVPCRGRGGRSGRAAAPGAWLAAALAVAGLGTAAYAAVPGEGTGSDSAREAAPKEIARPMITRHPKKTATTPRARFDFIVREPNLRFQCRLDRREWQPCRTPVVFKQLSPGRHSFSVRAVGRRGRRGPAARFRWRLLEPKGFSIAPRLADLSLLYPGAPPVSLPLTIANPNPAPIRVTALHVAVTADPKGCPSAANLTLAPAGVSSAAPLRVPAGGSVTLPAGSAAAPSIQLRDLPVNQDACQGVRFPLSFSGRARG